uniref:Uncharacterized protein n=1 Tax=Aegilops tauschii subsp. strangulata TaxID=200361 RepID=A0A453TD63_AEGTS
MCSTAGIRSRPTRVVVGVGIARYNSLGVFVCCNNRSRNRCEIVLIKSRPSPQRCEVVLIKSRSGQSNPFTLCFEW